MSCKYPLHPGQTEVSPYYVQVPMEEYESLKRENRQLHQLLNGVKSQNSDTEIDTLANECRILREMNTKAQEEIATLKENQRWRKFPDEKPSDDKQYLVYDTETHKYGKSFYSLILEEFQYPITHYMPLPKAPEGV